MAEIFQPVSHRLIVDIFNEAWQKFLLSPDIFVLWRKESARDRKYPRTRYLRERSLCIHVHLSYVSGCISDMFDVRFYTVVRITPRGNATVIPLGTRHARRSSSGGS